MEKPLTVFKKLGPKKLSDHHAFLLERIHDYNLGCSKDGQFAYLVDDFRVGECVDGELISDNQLKCFLRRDYIQKFQGSHKLSGKRLNHAIDWLIVKAKQAASNCLDDKKYEGLTALARIR